MTYIDGFLYPVPTKNLARFRKMAALGRKLWMKHGALQFVEALGDDMANPCGLPFPAGIQAKKSETVVFAFVVYKSKAHRKQVMAAVNKDPAGAQMTKDIPFDIKHMMCGGFKTLVSS